eukprot:GHUV01004185.1.p1 GENE.GHUV01004185.1~~GHUV01004185.1.p1  ORF type:complete len:530 (+),score=219.03 GHUV01004185.1:291-1880(+)
MSKRRATEELYTGDNRKRHDASTDRAVDFTAHLRALNSQFAQWVQEQAGSNSDLLWVDGAKDYVQFADKLLEDYEDVIKNGRSRSSTPLANNLFSTPGPAAAAAAGNLDAHTNRSIGAAAAGRKSVSFAATPTFSAAADGPAATTPGPANLSNTANAGHTPAPASGLGFTFGTTPGPNNGGDVPSPEPIKWGSNTPAAAAAQGAEASSSAAAAGSGAATSSGFTFGINQPSTTPPAATATATDAAPANTAFTFGVSNSSTPAAGSSGAAAASPTPAASPMPSSAGAGFTFGATPTASNSITPGGAATSSTPASTFTFGALPSTTAAAAGPSSSTPTFTFGAGADPGATGTAGGGLFKFSAPSAAAAGEGGGDADGAEDEAPPKYKPEITVDENTWKVFFSGKARLHVRRAKDGKTDWDAKGIGVLTVRQRKDGSDSSTYITFTNDGGKQLVSSRLQKTTDVHIVSDQPKKCRISLTVISYELPPAGATEATGAAASTGPKYSVEVCMIGLSTAEKMLELQKAVNEHKPK